MLFFEGWRKVMKRIGMWYEKLYLFLTSSIELCCKIPYKVIVQGRLYPAFFQICLFSPQEVPSLPFYINIQKIRIKILKSFLKFLLSLNIFSLTVSLFNLYVMIILVIQLSLIWLVSKMINTWPKKFLYYPLSKIGVFGFLIFWIFRKKTKK